MTSVQPTRPPHSNLGYRLFISVVLALILIEVYSWNISGSEWVFAGTQFDRELGWINTPNKSFELSGKTYSMNSRGFRSAETVSSQKENILILGDSVAYGLGVSDNETVSRYLNDMLEDHQVLNLAVPGYGISQYYLLLKKEIGEMRPALVIVFISIVDDLNDFRFDNLNGIPRPFFIIKNGELVQTNASISRASCATLFTKGWIANRLSLNRLAFNLCESQGLEEREIKTVAAVLPKKISELAATHNSRLLFVLSPTVLNFYFACAHESLSSFCSKNLLFFQDYVLKKRGNPGTAIDQIEVFTGAYMYFKSLFKENGYDFIDLFEKFMQLENALPKLYNNADWFHYSPEGNLLISRIISEHLKKPEGKFTSLAIKEAR